MSWIYKNTAIISVDQMPKGIYGFVYEIETEHGKKYIGQKTLFSRRKRKFGKKESKLVTDRRKKLYELIVKESKWQEYTGSNKELNEDITNGMKYTKKILYYAYHKKQLGFYETRELFLQRVLESNEFYNSNIQGKWFHKDTLPLI